MLKVTANGGPEPADRGPLLAVLLTVLGGTLAWAILRGIRNRR